MNILTFDIEEWYHIRFDNAFFDNYQLKHNLEKRLDYNVKVILDLLDKHDQKASFFCLGEVARNSPGVIKSISEKGHDIGCHSDTHKLSSSLSKSEFDYDLRIALDSIQSEIGKKVKMYRAPAFSITDNNLWALDALLDQGVEIDASIFPASRDYGGMSEVKMTQPSIFATPSGRNIKEFPMSTYNVLGKEMVFTGGGYFRLWPYRVIKYVVNNNDYTMTYFHPRDFDSGQPILEGLSLARRFKSYYGIKNAMHKLDLLLTDFEFMSIGEADDAIDWGSL